jgi:hypothetical protein
LIEASRNQMPERTTLEAYASIILATAIALVTSWWVQGVLLAVLITFVIDISFHSPLASRLDLRTKVIICLLSTALILVVGLRSVFNDYHVEASHENLLASFFVEMHDANSFNVEYSFFNQGGAAASIHSIGLAAILASNRTDEPSVNANLCENANPIRMLVTQLSVRLGLSEVANEAVTSESYRPKEILVDGAIWPPGRPIEVAAGKERMFSATYTIDPADPAKYNVMALCPTVEAYDDVGLGGTATCRGLLSSRSLAGLVAIRAAGRVRVLPRTRDLLCPPAQ